MGAGRDVYLMAFTCEPGRGSEPGVGFAFARAAAVLARQHGDHVVLVTRPHRVADIRSALGEDAAGIEILPVALPRPVVVLTGRALVRAAYVLWQWRAVAVVDRRLRAAPHRTAVVHHVTFATEALPTFEWRLARRAAIVFGPAGSTAVAGIGRGERLRRAVRDRVARANLGAADLLVAQNQHVRRSWARYGARIVVEPNVVIEPRLEARPPQQWAAAVVGRLIERKRVELAIGAFASSGIPGRMAVIGDGPERGRLEHAAARSGAAERIDFLGELPRDSVMDHLAASAVLLHPSKQEGAPWVVGEAQAVGTLPIVFTGSGADGPVSTADMGFVVDDPGQMAAALVDAVGEGRAPTTRWSSARLPDALAEWYDLATAAALRRR